MGSNPTLSAKCPIHYGVGAQQGRVIQFCRWESNPQLGERLREAARRQLRHEVSPRSGVRFESHPLRHPEDMTTIEAGANCCTAVVTVDADPEVIMEMKKHARRGLDRFSQFEGFVSGALHKSTDGGRLIQYLQWRREADHLACMNDPRWGEEESTRRILDHVVSGRATMDVRIYDVMAIM